MSLALAEIKNYKDVLSNGLSVVTIEMPHIHTVEVAMFIRAGLRFENASNNGVSHFLEHMIFRGNSKFPDSISLNKEFEKIGRDMRAYTTNEYTFYGFSPQSSRLDRGIEIFSNFFTQPTFPSIEIERGIILEEYLEEINEDGNITDIDNLACRLLYKDNPLAMSIIGTDKTIRAIDVPLLKNYFEEYYNPGNMVLAVAGAVTHETLVESAEKYFSRLPERGKRIARNHFLGSVEERQVQPGVLFQYDKDSQVQIQICFRGLSYNHEDYYKIILLSSLFDDGVSSRLQKAVREDEGLAYSIECSATSLSDTGTFDFDISVSPQKVKTAVEIIFREIKKFLREGPSHEEVEHFRNRYFFDLDFELDDPYKQILRYGFADLYSYQVSVEEERALVQSISAEDLWELGRRLFVPERLNLVLVGPHTPEMCNEVRRLAAEF